MSNGNHHTYRFLFMSMALSGLIGSMVILPHSTVHAGDASMATQLRSNSAPPGAWTSNSPDGGSILALAIDPVNSDILYAGTVAGIFKSTDGGASWFALNVGQGGLSINSIAIYPGNPDIVYAGGDDTRVFKSTDGGASWSASKSGLYRPFDGYGEVHVVKVSPRDSNIVYAGTDYPGGLFKSTDGGASWNAINNGLGGQGIWISALEMDPAEPDTLYTVSHHPGVPTELYSGLFKSTDGGASWSAAKSGLPTTSNEIVIALGDSRTIYAGTIAGLAKSTDGGQSWKIINSALHVGSLAVDPKNPDTIYVGATGSGGSANGVFKSLDAGATWSAINSNLLNTDTIAIDPRFPNTVYVGTFGGGVFKSIDAGMNWMALNAGLNSLIASALLVDRASPNIVYTGLIGGGLFKSLDFGASWSAINTGVPGGAIFVSDLQTDPFDADTLYAVTQAGFEGNFQGNDMGVIKSTDRGTSWNQVNNGLPGDVFALAIDPFEQNTLYAGTGIGLYRSTDGGASWSYASDAPARPHDPIFYLAIDTGSMNTIYRIGCNEGDDFCDAGPALSKSTDGGRSWKASISHFRNLYPYLFPICVTIDPSNSGILYVGASGHGVYKSTNGGASWSASNHGLSNLSVTAIVINPVDTRTLYAGTDREGVFRSTDGGATWSEFNIGLTNLSVHALTIDSLGMFLHAGTAAGVFDYQLGTRPTLTLGRSDYCIGESWNLSIANAPAGAEILLAGVRDQNPWSLPDWGITDQKGRYSASGIYIDGDQGTYEVHAEIGGIATNTLLVTVSDCKQPGARPTLTLDRSYYCIGEFWKLSITNAPADAEIRLAGAKDGNSWSMPDWGITDQNGSYRASGMYVDGNQGSYQLHAEIGGTMTETLFVTVSDCKQQ